jgi:hypothetical protein
VKFIKAEQTQLSNKKFHFDEKDEKWRMQNAECRIEEDFLRRPRSDRVAVALRFA